MSTLSQVKRRIANYGSGAVIYGLGIASLYVAEVLLARAGSTADVEAWTLLKSTMLIGGVFALFGLPAVLVRNPARTAEVARVMVFTSGVLGVVIAAFAMLIFDELNLLLIPILLLFCGVNILFQAYRSNGFLMNSYVAHSGWRILFLVLLAVALLGNGEADGLGISTMLLTALSIGFLASLAFLVRFKPRTDVADIHEDTQSIWRMYRTSSTFLLITLSLSVSAYGELILINTLADGETVKHYFAHMVIYMSPCLIINQFIMTVSEPAIRKNHESFTKRLRGVSAIHVLGAFLVLGAVFFAASYVLHELVFSDLERDILLAVSFAAIGAVRFVQLVPTAFNGVVLSREDIAPMARLYFASACALPPVAFLLFWGGIDALYAVVAATLLNWLMRAFIAMRATRRYLASSQQAT